MPDSSVKLPMDPEFLTRARELRRDTTPQERELWRHLRGKQLHGLRFRRQHPIAPFVVDFYCHEHKLVVEIDGHTHYEPGQQRYDRARTERLEQRGLRVVRFTNGDVDSRIDGVLQEIARRCGVDEAEDE